MKDSLFLKTILVTPINLFLSQIDACNGYYCDGFKPNSRTKPVLWTEDWDGWYVFVVQSSDKALLLSNKCFGEVFISRPMYQLALTVMLIGIWIK